MALADVLELSALFQGISHVSDDHLEAVAAFLEKRRRRPSRGADAGRHICGGVAAGILDRTL